MTRAIAAVLNWVVWGARYLYAGHRRVMGGLLVAGYIPIHWYWMVEIGAIDAFSGISLIVFIGHVSLSTGLAYDVYTTP